MKTESKKQISFSPLLSAAPLSKEDVRIILTLTNRFELIDKDGEVMCIWDNATDTELKMSRKVNAFGVMNFIMMHERLLGDSLGVARVQNDLKRALGV